VNESDTPFGEVSEAKNNDGNGAPDD